MAIRTIKDVSRAYDEGRYWSGFVRRGGPALTAGAWFDLSYASGIPPANYYAATPLVSATLNGNDGIRHGSDVAPLTKYLHKVCLLPPATSIGQAFFLLHDVVLYYPFVDGDGGYQDLINEVLIPRYSGEGCRIIGVVQGGGVASSACTIYYTNSQGVAGRTATCTVNMAQNVGALCIGANDAVNTAYPSAYAIMQSGDTGVRSIEAIDVALPVGGIFALAIVKPVASFSVFTNERVPQEKEFFRDFIQAPTFADSAYLAAVVRCTTSATPTTILAQFDFIWG